MEINRGFQTKIVFQSHLLFTLFPWNKSYVPKEEEGEEREKEGKEEDVNNNFLRQFGTKLAKQTTETHLSWLIYTRFLSPQLSD